MAEATEAQEFLRAGKLPEALKALENAVRKNPADPALRVFLFQLLCVIGQWDRALTQVKLSADMEAKNALLPHMYGDAIQCEALRSEVFAGKRQPLLFGKPAEWAGWLVQASQLAAQGKMADAKALRDQAFEAAPTTSGTITTKDGEQPFEWIADGDGRLGPVLEIILEGRYFWVPFNYIQQIKIEEPVDLRDMVWTPAQFTWSNGGTSVGLIPTRYAGSEKSTDGALAMSRATQWNDAGEDLFIGVGQRLLATDAGEFPLVDIRLIKLNTAEAEPQTDRDAAGAKASMPPDASFELRS